jgi:carbonic anhydrase/acetyltransferase-like protein (isoleucine patch superfamily)
MEQHAQQPLVVGIGGREPSVDPEAWVAPTASVVGAVTLAAGASVWYGAVVRADDESVTIGRDTNVQDGAVLHADPGFPCSLADRVTVGHGAIVHGATVGAGSLVGMGARVLNGASIGERCMVAAGALVPEGFTAPPGVLVMGVPARVRRDLREDELAQLRETAEEYAANARRHRARFDTASGAALDG